MAQIHQEQPAQSVRALCALFGASRGWSYARPAADDDRVARDVALRDAIEALLLEFPGYGYRRVTHALPRAGWTVTQKRVPRVPRVPRVRREESLLCQLKRRFVVPSPRDARHPFTTYPNLLADAVLDAPTQAWGADITALRLPTTFVSPAAHDLCLFGLPVGRLRAALCRRAPLAPDRYPSHAGGAGDGRAGPPTATGADSPFGSRGPVRRCRVRGLPGTGGGAAEQGGGRQSLRQRQGRKRLQDLDA